MYSDHLDDILFADFIHSVKLGVSQQDIVNSAKELQRRHESVLKSNHGGYQSPMYTFDKGCENSVIDEMVGVCYKYASEFLRERFKSTMDPQTGFDAWWMNISAEGAFNAVHNHGRTDLCGIYFAAVPEGSGVLSLQRNDGSSYTGLYQNVHGGDQFDIYPEAGRLYLFPGHLWHSVGYTSSKEERISFAFNYRIES